ncbi:MAG: hypothetical protein A2V93_12475 [Ignavibacteria bacterium RBG_16_34_14]|nr:MAG: hypothetical protein A2V93_12475 [Ignavibacteria bacterium RBG_16_34_14]
MMESKSLFKLLLFSLFVLSFSPLHAQTKLYEFESAYVKKTTTTSGSSIEVVTTEEIFITDYGKKSASYKTEKRNIKMLKKTEESSSVHIMDGEWIITYNPKTKEGTKMKNVLADKFKNMSEKDAEKMVKVMKEALKTETKELGSETVSGKKCKVTLATSNIAGMKTTAKVWTYKNFLMKSESESLGNKVKEEVAVFKEGEKVDKNKFMVPKDVKIKEVKY